MILSDECRRQMRVPYVLRRVGEANIVNLLADAGEQPHVGDVVLAEITRVGKNATLELANGRRCSLHERDLVAAVFGNRYATMQFEGYARREGDTCDLLSMGGVCGRVETRHAKVAEPTKLRLLGALGDHNGNPLRLRDFHIDPPPRSAPQRTIVVCGSSMDSGKTHTAISVIVGLHRRGHRVGGIKLTGTATGKDTWSMLDAGACIALDFVDGGWPSTYMCTRDELLATYRLLSAEASAAAVDWVVVEIADGLLQKETADLLRSPEFQAAGDAWIFAAGDPMAAESGARMLQNWGIKPLAISGLTSMSPLCVRETEQATGLPCFTADALQSGALNDSLTRRQSMENKHFSAPGCGVREIAALSPRR